jgi:hypothetical protein
MDCARDVRVLGISFVLAWGGALPRLGMWWAGHGLVIHGLGWAWAPLDMGWACSGLGMGWG